MRKYSSWLVALLAIAAVVPSCAHREKRSVTIEGPQSKTQVEITREHQHDDDDDD